MTVNGVVYNPYVYFGAQNSVNANFSQYATAPAQNTFRGDEFVLSNPSSVKAKTPAQELKAQLEETKGEQGIIGKVWDGLKNLTGLGAGSNKAEEAIKKFEKGEISEEEARKAVGKYEKGQKQAVDFVADMATGLIAVAAAAAAPVTGGASLLLAAGIGAVVKPTIKGIDAISGGREYSMKECLRDAAGGAINGVLGTITGGIGKAVTSGAKNVVMSIVKERVLSTGEKIAIRVATKAVGSSVSGALFGGSSSGASYVLDGGELGDEGFFEAVINGAKGGAIVGGLTGGIMEGVDIAKAKATVIGVVPNTALDTVVRTSVKKLTGVGQGTDTKK